MHSSVVRLEEIVRSAVVRMDDIVHSPVVRLKDIANSAVAGVESITHTQWLGGGYSVLSGCQGRRDSAHPSDQGEQQCTPQWSGWQT